MLTMFCLLFYGMFPSQMGIPIWALFLSLAIDTILIVMSSKKRT